MATSFVDRVARVPELNSVTLNAGQTAILTTTTVFTTNEF